MCGGMPGGTSLNSGRGPHVLLALLGVGGRYSVPAAWAVLISESGISDSGVTAAHDSAHVSVTSTLRLNSMALPRITSSITFWLSATSTFWLSATSALRGYTLRLYPVTLQ